MTEFGIFTHEDITVPLAMAQMAYVPGQLVGVISTLIASGNDRVVVPKRAGIVLSVRIGYLDVITPDRPYRVQLLTDGKVEDCWATQLIPINEYGRRVEDVRGYRLLPSLPGFSYPCCVATSEGTVADEH